MTSLSGDCSLVTVEGVRRAGLAVSNGDIVAEIVQFLEASYPIFRVGEAEI